MPTTCSSRATVTRTAKQERCHLHSQTKSTERRQQQQHGNTMQRQQHVHVKRSLLLTLAQASSASLFSILNQCPILEARGGGSKRTFGSPKSQSSQSQNLADCTDQNVCQPDQSDSSWTSALAATMALVGPLLVLITLIAMIKFCFARAYPKGYHIEAGDDAHRQCQQAESTNTVGHTVLSDESRPVMSTATATTTMALQVAVVCSPKEEKVIRQK